MSFVDDRVAEIRSSRGLVDPHQIAELILPELKGKKALEVLAEILPEQVRLALTRGRGHQFDRDDPSIPSANTQSASAGSSRSEKWLRVAAVFNDPYCVADGWKHLGDCTVEDIGFLEDDRHTRAKQLSVKGDQFGALKALMIRRGVTRVRDLPESEVAEVLS